MKTFIFSKTPQETVQVKVDLSYFKENIQEAELIKMFPDIEAEFFCEEKTLFIKFVGGENHTTYGLSFLIKTIEESSPITIVMQVDDTPLFEDKKLAPDSFMDLLGTMQAGNSAVGTVVFTLPKDIELEGEKYVVWDLIDSESNILASGNSFDLIQNEITNALEAKCLITVPSTLSPTSVTKRYQIRYCLILNKEKFYQFETLKIESKEGTEYLGTEDTVELQGTKTCMQIITQYPADKVIMELYKDNKLLASQDMSNFGEKVSSGWRYGGYIDTHDLAVSLDNYDVIFKYSLSSSPLDTFQENKKLWVVNPSILSAAKDILEKVNKARTTLYGAPDLVYTMPCLLTWLRRGADRFNGAYGIITSFTFTNAKGGIREYWLMWAELMALESQYLAEGEKAFDFQGAAIQLTVDRTQYLDTVRGNLQSVLDNEFKPFKQNLTIKGNTAGDGSGEGGKDSSGSIGAVAITITPVTGWGRYYPGNYYTKWF